MKMCCLKQEGGGCEANKQGGRGRSEEVGSNTSQFFVKNRREGWIKHGTMKICRGGQHYVKVFR